MARKFGWSKNVLVHQIENQSYEKTLLGQTNFDKALAPAQRGQANGIILCKEKRRMIVEYALRDVHKPIGVATYRICISAGRRTKPIGCGRSRCGELFRSADSILVVDRNPIWMAPVSLGGSLRLNTRWQWRHTCTSGRRRCCRVKVRGEMPAKHGSVIRRYEVK